MTRAYPPTGSQLPSVELIVRKGPRPGQRFSLAKPTIIIGREAGNDVVVNVVRRSTGIYETLVRILAPSEKSP